MLVLLLAAPTVLLAQAPENGTPTAPFDSPLITPTVAATATDVATATDTATATATLTPSPTPTQDLSSAVLQVSPLRIAPDDRPINNLGAMLWLVAALTLVLAGAVVMTVRK